MAARAVAHHNAVLRAAQARALDMEGRLAAILEPILNDAGDEAARRFLQIVRPVQLPSLEAAAPPGAHVGRHSTMIAVKPTPEQAARIAETSEHDADDLHVTLAYLGRVEGDLAPVLDALQTVAASHAALEGTVGGVGVFADNGKGHPSILLPSVPGLVELRVEVTEALVEAGYDFGRGYGFQPHMTHGYIPTPDTPPVELLGLPLSFLDICVVRGGDEEHRLPLVGGKPVTASADLDVRGQVAETAERVSEYALPDYGDTYWNAETRTVYWIVADYTSNDEINEGVEAFEAIEGVEECEACDECGAPEGDGWERVWPTATTASVLSINRYDLSGVTYETFAGQPGWVRPSRDELLDAAALADRIRTKTQPVMHEVVKTVVSAGLANAGQLTAAGDKPPVPELSWDVTNPFTAKVLAQTGSQVTNISKTTQAGVMASVNDAYKAGMSIPQTADLIREGMRAASPARATLIARTELAGAVNGGSLAATQIVSDATGLNMTKEWLTAPGAQFPRHETYDGLDGQTTTLDGFFNVGGADLQFPGDPAGPPEEVCNCFPGSTSVIAPGLEMGFRRRYDGDLVRVEVMGVGHLAGTPNHPVLTDTGWKPLGSLREGDHLVCAVPRQHEGAVDPHVDNRPAAIHQVFSTLAGREVPRRVRGRAVQFHGDASADGEVEVVAADSYLRRRLDATEREQVGELDLTRTSEPQRLLARASSGFDLSVADRPGTTGGVRSRSESAALSGGEVGHTLSHRVGPAAWDDADVTERPRDDGPANGVVLGERLYGETCVVSLAQVVTVERDAFHGDVFNLQTKSGTYLANHVISHNCRCTIVYVEAGDVIATGDAEEQLDPQSAADEAAAAAEDSGGGGESEDGTGDNVPALPSFPSAADETLALPTMQGFVTDGEATHALDAAQDEWGKTLSQDDRDALQKWRSETGYEQINGYLRNGVEEPGVKETVDRLDRLTSSAPPMSSNIQTIAYRGLKDIDNLIGTNPAIGHRFTDNGFQSLTTEISVASDYTSYTSTSGILQVELPEGYRGGVWMRSAGVEDTHGGSDWYAEGENKELLVRREQTWEVVGTSTHDGIPVVRVRPVEDVVVPLPAIEPPPSIAAPADRPYAHVKDVTLDTQLYRTKKLMTDMLGKPPSEWTAKMNADYETARVKLQHLDREKAYRLSLPERPYAHYAPATLKTQLYRVNKRLAELDPRKASLTVQERGEWNQLHDKLRGLLAEQKARGVEPLPPKPKPGMKVTPKPVAPPVAPPSVKPPANERMARLQDAYARRGERTLTLTDPHAGRYADAENVPLDIHEAEQELTAIGNDVRDEIDARLEARGGARFANYDTRRDTLVEVLSEIRTLGRGGIEMGSGNDVFVNAGATRTPAWKSVNKMADQYLPTDWLKNMTRPLDVGKSQRGYFRAYGGKRGGHLIKVSARYGHTAEAAADSHAQVAIHELGHLMEEIVPGIKQAEMSFYGRRTYDEATGMLEKTRRYRWGRASEQVRPDRFLDEYMGKTYGNTSSSAYEILSMGLESIFTGSNNLWAGDPDMANFILGLLVGV